MKKSQPAGEKKRKERGNRKASKFNGTKESSDEEEDLDALLCPLANTGQHPDNGIPWEIHMPAKEGEIQFKIDTGADVTVSQMMILANLG